MTSSHLPESPAFHRFRDQEGAVQRLAQVLNDPALTLALQILDDMARPTLLPESQAGVHHDTTVTHHFHLLLGAKKALDLLKKMATPKTPQERLDEEASPERPDFSDYAEKIQPLNFISR